MHAHLRNDEVTRFPLHVRGPDGKVRPANKDDNITVTNQSNPAEMHASIDHNDGGSALVVSPQIASARGLTVTTGNSVHTFDIGPGGDQPHQHEVILDHMNAITELKDPPPDNAPAL